MKKKVEESPESPKMQIKGIITIEVLETADKSDYSIRMKCKGLNALERYGVLIAACKNSRDENREISLNEQNSSNNIDSTTLKTQI